jgi:hypothetical protein
MTLSDLASIGSLVSGTAVLVSLVYLSLQNRQLGSISTLQFAFSRHCGRQT